MDSVKEIKDWLMNKFHSASSSNGAMGNAAKGMGPLTPHNIPEFVIPGSGESSRRTSEGSMSSQSNVSKRNSYGGRSYASSPPGSPVHMASLDSSYFMHPGGMPTSHSSSAPVTPKHELPEVLICKDTAHSTTVLDNMTDDTNVDPLSFAAMSLPHFRMQTSYGFSTLSESPHTRRKESLFHMSGEGLLNKKKLYRQNSESEKYMNLLPRCLPNGHTMATSMPSVVVTSVSHSATDNQEPMAVPNLCNRRLSPTYQAFHGTETLPMPSRHNRFYNRRRSSLVGLTDSEGCPRGNTSGNSSPDTARRSLGDLEPPLVAPATIKRHSAPQIPTDPLRGDESPKLRSRSCQLINKGQSTTSLMFAPFGELKFSFHYLAASKQLKLTLIKAENLGGRCKPDQSVNSYVKTCLMPGKVQKQLGPVAKHTKNPFYNQDFHFQNLTLDELHSMTLRIKIFSRANNLKLPEFIGEVNISLDGYDLLIENRIWKDLESRKDREELGFLELGVMLEPREGTMSVSVVQAKSLPQHPLTGAPDPYVRVEVTQPNHSLTKKQTHIRKNTSHPEFNETFVFNISSKTDDLNGTCVNVAVFDHDRIRSDDVIGHVLLGVGAQEASQFEHWNEILQNPGKLISKWHYLIDIDF